MLAYVYDEDTKEYLYPLEAQKDPLGNGYFLPAYGTFLPPKECGKFEINIFENGEWVVKKDYRAHLQLDVENFIFYKVDFIGDVKEGFQFVTTDEYDKFLADPKSFKIINGRFIDITDTKKYKNLKLQEVKEIKGKQACYKAEKFLKESSFELTEGFHIEATKENMNTMLSHALVIDKGIIESQFWVSKEDSIKKLSKEQCFKIYKGIKDIQDDIWNNQYLAIIKLIENSKTIEEVQAVEIKYKKLEQ